MTGTTAASVRNPTGDWVVADADAFHTWWSERHRAGQFEVTPIPFAELDAWRFDETTGNLGHDSGRFFSVEGLQVRTGTTVLRSQPIIHQPEIGVLGIVVKEFGGVTHCLMQAKMEPGNVNVLQLSPTVQATRSNYTQVHRGSGTRYLEYFTGPDRGEVLVDVLQSEQGSWFWRKRNRNIVVRVIGDVPLDEDFRWLPLPLLRELLKTDNLINMDARTVLSCIPDPDADDGPALHTSRAVLSWFTESKTRCDWHVRLTPLNEVEGWSRTGDEIARADHELFRIIGVRVRAGNREVAEWTQPLLQPRGQARAIFVTRRINGVRHLLVRARPEYGLMDLVEMAPTVQLVPGEDGSGMDAPFLKDIVTGGAGQVHYDTVLSEEGGRFHHALTRYQIIEVGDEFPVEVPADFCWLTVRQLTKLLRHGHYLTIEARTLLACAQVRD